MLRIENKNKAVNLWLFFCKRKVFTHHQCELDKDNYEALQISYSHWVYMQWLLQCLGSLRGKCFLRAVRRFEELFAF